LALFAPVQQSKQPWQLASVDCKVDPSIMAHAPHETEQMSMDDRMKAGMAEATRLTRAGRLAEATAVIQQTLQGAFPVNGTTVTPDDTIIDAEFHVVDDTPPATTMEKPSENSAFWKGTPVPPHGTQPSMPVNIPFPNRGYRSAHGDSPSTPKRTGYRDHTNGRFVDGLYIGTAGKRTYKLYIPSGFTGQPLPLLIMLHGCTQSPLDFARGTRMNMLAEKNLCFVAYPEQEQPANRSRCWNWFQATNQQRGVGEPSLIAGITRQIMSNYPVDASRVYVAGLSSGGAMAAIMAATYPDLYAAVGVHSGIAYAAAQDLRSALKVMQQGATRQARTLREAIPIIIFHGYRDTTVSPLNADRMLEQWLQAAPDRNASRKSPVRESVVSGQVAGGRAYTRGIYIDAAGRTLAEKWIIRQAGHAWSGGSSSGSFTDPQGPDASAEMLRFFADHPKKG
jgi:poly(hydroxyalkanoate) depolymerase family esterase